MVETLEQKILDGQNITKEEAKVLIGADLKTLTEAADRLRQHFCGNACDVCSVISVKAGRCTEDCKYCAQSRIAKTNIEEESVLGQEIVTTLCKQDIEKGTYRFGLVAEGRRLSEREVALAAENIRQLKEQTEVYICGSFGLLSEADFMILKEAGMSMIHNNLETSDNFFPKLCTSHTIDDKRKTILAAKRQGLKICSGGIIGLGETMEDRIDLAFSLRELDVDSVPLNMLNPVEGTCFADHKPMEQEEFLRTVAIFRFVLPTVMIRLAAGRAHLADKGKAALRAGANAVISGDFLTTSGISFETDLKMIAEQGYTLKNR